MLYEYAYHLDNLNISLDFYSSGLDNLGNMDDDSDNFYREIRYSRLKDQDEHSSPTNRKPKINGSATQNSDLYPDSGFNSDVSTGNGDIAGKACSDRVNGLGTLHENHVKHGYRTLEVPEGEKSDSNNGGNSSEQIPEQKFSFKTLTKDQKVILASTSFTNLLSYLSLSILAPFFPKEVRVIQLLYTLLFTMDSSILSPDFVTFY